MSGVKEKIELFLLIRRKWEKRSTLALITIINILFNGYLCSKYINLAGREITEIFSNISGLRNVAIIFCLIEVFVLILWFSSRKIKKAGKNQIGILFAIKTETEREKTRIKNDFIEAIKQILIRKGQFKIIELSEYHVDKMLSDDKYLIKYHYKSNCKLIVFGRTETRMHCSDESYCLNLEASVIHHPIPDVVSNALGQQMKSVLPLNKIIPVKDEYFGFKISTNLFTIAARYIIGIAALYSNKTNEAIELHNGILLEKIDFPDKSHEKIAYEMIINNTKKLVVNEANILAYIGSSINNNLSEMKKYSDIARSIDPDNYPGHLAEAIIIFIESRNVVAALKELEPASKNRNEYTWAYSKAFLFAYDGQLDEAYKTYQIAFYHPTQPSSHLQSEEFMQKILNEEPNKIQLLYCIGLLNLFKKEDYQLASEYFSEFIKRSKELKLFESYIQFAEKYLLKINAKSIHP